MKIAVNDSRRSTQDLQELVDFVTEYFQYPHLATLYFSDGKEKGFITSGIARKFHYESVIYHQIPGAIHIEIGHGVYYPTVSVYRKRVGPVTFTAWQEEVLFVLAHEFRHIDQFWSLKRPKHFEVDAERFAKSVLEKYVEHTSNAEWRACQIWYKGATSDLKKAARKRK